MIMEFFTKSPSYLMEKYFGDQMIKASRNGIYLVAHSDTVFAREPKEDEIVEFCGGIYTAPKNGLGADNRVGLWTVYIISQIITECGWIISPDEETGDNYLTNNYAVYDITPPKLFVSFDRKGMSEYVDYNYYNSVVKDKLQSLGIKRTWGTYSTVSLLSRMFDVACVNLCICGDNFHSKTEWWNGGAYCELLFIYIDFIKWAAQQNCVFSIEDDPDKPIYDIGWYWNMAKKNKKKGWFL